MPRCRSIGANRGVEPSAERRSLGFLRTQRKTAYFTDTETFLLFRESYDLLEHLVLYPSVAIVCSLVVNRILLFGV